MSDGIEAGLHEDPGDWDDTHESHAGLGAAEDSEGHHHSHFVHHVEIYERLADGRQTFFEHNVGNGRPDMLAHDRDGDGRWDDVELDTDNDGAFDIAMVDT